MKYNIEAMVNAQFAPHGYALSDIIPTLFISCFGEISEDEFNIHPKWMDRIFGMLLYGWGDPQLEDQCTEAHDAWTWFNHHVLDHGYDPRSRLILFEKKLNMLLNIFRGDEELTDKKELSLLLDAMEPYIEDAPLSTGRLFIPERFFEEGHRYAGHKRSLLMLGDPDAEPRFNML